MQLRGRCISVRQKKCRLHPATATATAFFVSPDHSNLFVVVPSSSSIFFEPKNKNEDIRAQQSTAKHSKATLNRIELN